MGALFLRQEDLSKVWQSALALLAQHGAWAGPPRCGRWVKVELFHSLLFERKHFPLFSSIKLLDCLSSGPAERGNSKRLKREDCHVRLKPATFTPQVSQILAALRVCAVCGLGEHQWEKTGNGFRLHLFGALAVRSQKLCMATAFCFIFQNTCR